MSTEKYTEELLKLIDICQQLITQFPNTFGGLENQEFALGVGSDHRKYLRDPTIRKYKEDLRYIEEMHLIYFQEGHGEVVELFWHQIKAQNLPFLRVNKMAKILKRGRIKDQEEYDFVTDVIVPYKQEGMITEEQEIRLNEMLGKFEMKNK
jgi:hypothetical protein